MTDAQRTLVGQFQCAVFYACRRNSGNTGRLTLVLALMRASTAAMPLFSSCSLTVAIRRSRPASSFASARATSTSWVFEARSSHQPSAVLTRTPSVELTSAPSAASRVGDFVDHRELAALVDREAQFGGRDRYRHFAPSARSATCRWPTTASIRRTAA